MLQIAVTKRSRFIFAEGVRRVVRGVGRLFCLFQVNERKSWKRRGRKKLCCLSFPLGLSLRVRNVGCGHVTLSASTVYVQTLEMIKIAARSLQPKINSHSETRLTQTHAQVLPFRFFVLPSAVSSRQLCWKERIPPAGRRCCCFAESRIYAPPTDFRFERPHPHSE